MVFLGVFSAIMFFVPEMGGYFLEANNFIPADPLKTPEHIAPVWYFTPYYAILRAVPSFLDSQFWGVLAMGVAVMIFFFLPWLDRGAVKSIRYRGTLYKSWLAAFVISFLILGYLGVVPVTVWGQFPESWPILGGADKATVVARVLTVVYFLFFLLMPWYTARDKTKPVPERVPIAMNNDRLPFSPLLCRLPAPALALRRRRRPPRSRAHPPARRRVAAARRAQLRQLLPQLPQREVHALRAAEGHRPHRAADQGQPDVRRPTRSARPMTVAMTDGRGARLVRRGAARPVGRGARARRRLAVQLLPRVLPRRRVRRPAGTTSCSRTSACRTCCGSCPGPNKLVSTEFDSHEKAHRRRHRHQGPRARSSPAPAASGSCAP